MLLAQVTADVFAVLDGVLDTHNHKSSGDESAWAFPSRPETWGITRTSLTT